MKTPTILAGIVILGVMLVLSLSHLGDGVQDQPESESPDREVSDSEQGVSVDEDQPRQVITAQVVDGSTGRFLPGVSARVVEIASGATTEAKSDEEGRLELDIPAGDSWLNLKRGDLAAAPTFVKQSRAAGLVDIGLIALMPTGSLNGSVVDESGDTVTGATVRLRRLHENAAGMGADIVALAKSAALVSRKPEFVLETETDEQGRFAYDAVAFGDYVVEAELVGRSRGKSAVRRIGPGPSRSECEVVLETGITLTGSVFDEKDAPIEGAEVSVLAVDLKLLERVMFSPFGLEAQSIRASTDHLGKFEITACPRGILFLTTHAAGYNQSGAVGTATGSVDLVARLNRAAQVQGEVTDEVTGAAVPDIDLLFGSVTGSSPASAKTSAEGAFQAPLGFPLTFGNFIVCADDPVWSVVSAGKADSNPIPGGAMVELDASDEVTLQTDVVVSRGGTIRGRFVDRSSREGVSGARVGLFTAFSRMGFLNASLPSTTTDADGNFKLVHVPIGRFSLLGSHPEYCSSSLLTDAAQSSRSPEELQSEFLASLSDVESESLIEDRRLELDRGLRLSGIVVDNVGRPIPGAEIDVAEMRDGEFAAGRLFVAAQRGPFTDAAGRFELNARRSGTKLSVLASHPDFPTVDEVINFEVDGSSREIRLVLRKGANLTGVAVDDDGKPIVGLLLEYTPAQGKRLAERRGMVRSSSLSAVTDGDGRFAFADVPSGLGKLSLPDQTLAIQPGADPRRLACRLPDDNREFDLKPGEDRDLRIRLEIPPVITGRIVDRDGRPVLHVAITARPRVPAGADAGPRRRGTLDSTGHFTISDINTDLLYDIEISGRSGGAPAFPDINSSRFEFFDFVLRERERNSSLNRALRRAPSTTDVRSKIIEGVRAGREIETIEWP